MKSSKRSLALLSAATLLLFTSCNRGMGCPTNFSIEEFVSALIALAV